MKNIPFKNTTRTKLAHKKTGPSVETERPLRLLDMRLFKYFVSIADSFLNNILSACVFLSEVNLEQKRVVRNSTYFLFYHARRDHNIFKPFVSMRLT
ncbi:MAG: hypothetical protein ABIN25_06155 [Ginsengibacter sp.]